MRPLGLSPRRRGSRTQPQPPRRHRQAMRALGRLARDADGPGVLGAAADRLLKPFGVPAGTHEALAEADVYIVTRLSVPENRELAIRLVLPFGVLSDPSGETTDLFVRGGDAHSLGAHHVHTRCKSPSPPLDRSGDGEAHVRGILETLDTYLRRGRTPAQSRGLQGVRLRRDPDHGLQDRLLPCRARGLRPSAQGTTSRRSLPIDGSPSPPNSTARTSTAAAGCARAQLHPSP